jgi:hypothetical protein
LACAATGWQLVYFPLLFAIREGATEIEFEPSPADRHWKVRFKVDRDWEEVPPLPFHLRVSREFRKICVPSLPGTMLHALNRLAYGNPSQEQCLNLLIAGHAVDLRVSFRPPAVAGRDEGVLVRLQSELSPEEAHQFLAAYVPMLLGGRDSYAIGQGRIEVIAANNAITMVRDQSGVMHIYNERPDFHVFIKITNEDDFGILHYAGFYGDYTPKLRNNRGKEYQLISIPAEYTLFDSRPGKSDSGDWAPEGYNLHPGESVIDTLIFERPAKYDWLELELPLATFGEERRVRFVLRKLFVKNRPRVTRFMLVYFGLMLLLVPVSPLAFFLLWIICGMLLSVLCWMDISARRREKLRQQQTSKPIKN